MNEKLSLNGLNGCLPAADMREMETERSDVDCHELNERVEFEWFEWMSAGGRHWCLLRLSEAMSIVVDEW
jgi:hypothetical protein